MRLPDYKGRFPVSVATFKKPIRPSYVYSNARLNGKPALKLEEIAYTVYYPTSGDRTHGGRGVHWLPRPLSVATAGWAMFAARSYWLLWPFIYLFARFIRLPTYMNAPLRPYAKSATSHDTDSSTETLADSGTRWPLVIFSHGLAGGRFTYSDYCGRLASQGMVVIALEHRDGSGPFVIPTDEDTGEPIPKLYLQTNGISWEEEPAGKLPLRVDQLKFRIREIYEAFESFGGVVRGDRRDTTPMDTFSHWDSFKDQVDFSQVLLTGHSFGGATSLSLLSNPPPEGHNQLPIKKVVLLDPWLDPLPLPIAYEARPPLLIMNSESFTLWKEHFAVLEQVVADWRKSGGDECASLITIVRSQHHHYSDFGAFVPFGKARALGLLVLDTAHKLTMAYIRGSLPSELKGKRSLEVEPVPGKDKYGEGKRRIVGDPGESIGLSSGKATEAARGTKTAASLKELIQTHGLESKGLDEKQGTLVASLATQERVVFEEGFLKALHKPGGNPQISPKLREQHLKTTGGQVFTRFPPEPNGFLHIGHSKAIFVNFGYAAHHNGKCYLRYDDTNPEAEEAIYFESILETIRWLGYEPYKITYSSDYFQELYDLAVKLIQVDKAYICHCTAEEIKANRGGEERGPRKACVHRTRPTSESLAEFENMKNGKYKPGEAILRMKQDLEDGNPQMWDLIAYRTLHAPHHRTGTKWCIYPTYDFTHCLVDSFENISHSLCTTEFILSRVSYEWLCDAVEVYKPRQSEYGRLNLQGTIMSKRKLLKLVTKGYVGGWDDPRLYTLVALRRRGVPPGAILSFVGNLGVSTATTNIELAKFEQTLRQYLENTVPRLLMVLRPLKVTIENLADDYVQFIDKPLHPKVPSLGSSRIPFTKHVYIDAEDFRTEDSKDYFRLAPNKTVGLFQAPHPITCVSYKTDAGGAVTELVCRIEDGSDGKLVPKPKAWIQWVAEHPPSGSPVVVDETRIFHSLFKSDNPAATDDFLADVNPHSLDVIKGAMAEVGFWPLAKRCMSEALKESRERTEKALKEESVGEGVGSGAAGHNDTPMPTAEQLVGNEVVRFQGLRVAYFALDKEARVGCFDEPNDATPGRREGDKLVLNRIVSLKEDTGKKAA
ncbi:hypothetical protein FRC11_007850 [Ceratobasidium sp. 423]|nr:hypothetical protein FRC11_007850 [Ceratobasidium sp. 423]